MKKCSRDALKGAGYSSNWIYELQAGASLCTAASRIFPWVDGQYMYIALIWREIYIYCPQTKLQDVYLSTHLSITQRSTHSRVCRYSRIFSFLQLNKIFLLPVFPSTTGFSSQSAHRSLAFSSACLTFSRLHHSLARISLKSSNSPGQSFWVHPVKLFLLPL